MRKKDDALNEYPETAVAGHPHRPGNRAESIASFRSLLAAAPVPDDSGTRLRALHALGDLYTELGDVATGLEYYLEAERESEAIDDFEARAVVLGSIGLLYGEQGEHDKAIAHLEESRALLRESGSRLMELKTIRNLGAIHLARGDLAEAEEYELRALAAYDLLDDRTNAAAAMITLGGIHERKEEPAEALSFFLRASNALGASDDHALFATALLGAGRCYFEMGQRDSARFALEQGLAIVRELDDSALLCRFCRRLADTHEALGDHRAALEFLREATSLERTLADRDRRRRINELQARFDLEQRLKDEEIRRRSEVGRAMIRTQEEERSRIAGDLHDGVGQLVATARMHLLRVRATKPTESDDSDGSPLHRSIELLERASADIRTISHALGSSTLRELGIGAALAEIVGDLDQTGPTRFRLDVVDPNDHLADLPDETLLGLFRIAQELILNVVRHAGASQATVTLAHHGDSIILMVTDDGVGFDPEQPRTGMGTRNIAARAESIGGRVLFDSEPGQGTTVTCEVETLR